MMNIGTGLRWRWRTLRTPHLNVAAEGVRLLIGPTNSAGQAYRWARVADRLPGVAAASFAVRPPQDRFRFPADAVVDLEDFTRNYIWWKRQQREVTTQFTHIIFESGRGLWRGALAEEQIRSLQAQGIRVGLLFHGSDIRVPHRHAELEPDSPFAGGAYAETELLEQKTAANHELVRAAGVPVFVSTPQLLDFLPEATWLPVVIDPQRWNEANKAAPLMRRRPLVVHAPSRRGLKGSERIEATLRALDEKGLITYREVQGIRSDDMPALYGDADIVLDQFVIGEYGVAACEAMAAGRLVLAHVADRHRDAVRARTGLELPIIEARATDIGSVIERILAERERYREFAAQGPGFVNALHAGTASAEVLAGFLGVGRLEMFRDGEVRTRR